MNLKKRTKVLPRVIYIYIYIYIYPFWRAIYRSDNLLQIPPSRELFFYLYFRRRGLYRCIEPSIQKYIWFCPQLRANSYIFQEIYMILPATAGKIIYISKNIYDFARSCGQKRIYIIYMGSCRAKYSNIAPRPRIWFVLGLRPRTNQILGLGAI